MSAQSAEVRAMRIAEAAAEAWYQTQGSSDYATAVGVVAALALMERADPSGPDPAKVLIESSDEEIAGALTQIWSLFRMARPELARLVGPLTNWLNDDNPVTGKAHAIASVVRAAAKNGLLDLASSGSLRDTDVVGITYQQMRSRSGAAPEWARGEFSIPPEVCKAMAAMSLGGTDSLKPGTAIATGPAGTGEMLRAAAEHIREHGMDPAGFWWIVNGISPAAVAVTAVNCHLWGLGPRVVIGVADPVADPGWQERAWAEQQAVIAYRDDAVRGGATAAKSTWTARTQGQLVAALARKGWSRDSVRDACHRAYRDGSATTLNMVGDLAAFVTFGNTEVDLWDAEIRPGSDAALQHGAQAVTALGHVSGPSSDYRARQRDPHRAQSRGR